MSSTTSAPAPPERMDLQQLVSHLAEERNLDFRGYKPSSLERRFRHRMFQVKIAEFDDYARYIAEHPEEINQLLNAVLINVTKFFRDPQAWEFLRRSVLPQMTAEMNRGDTLRAWSAGCASGEEAYSLAILLAEHFGADLRHYDVKVYGTDIDEEALATARRGVYSADKLEQVPADLRERYFVRQGDGFRVQRDVRRLAIFGRANLGSDAPISHVHLLLCRNVLIYFDSDLQRKILRRLHYALEPGAILMLGKAETQLSQSELFEVVHQRWRIFRRVPAEGAAPRPFTPSGEEDLLVKARTDYALLKAYHEGILETLEPGIVVLDAQGTVISDNEAAQRVWGLDSRMTGKSLLDTEMFRRCPELHARIEEVNNQPEKPLQFESEVPMGEGETRTLAITVKSIRAEKGKRSATLIYAEDVSSRQRLQHTIEELETTSEELQSTNEELETTNEELQSTNEELETTNEELQSTNEELETTNEELQALNEELGTTNEELEVRTRELDSLNERYSETLEHMPWPVLLVGEDQVIHFWNSAAQRVFGLGSKSIVGLALTQLPLQHKFRNTLVRRYRESVVHNRPRLFRGVEIETNNFRGLSDLHFTPLGKTPAGNSTLVVIELEAPRADGGPRKAGRGKAKRSGASKKKASRARKSQRPAAKNKRKK